MKKLFILWIALSLVLGGCEMFQSMTDGAPGQTKKEDFQGYYMEVWVDGQKTENKGKKTSLQQMLWNGPESTSGNPEIKFMMDKERLGDFQAAEIVINPLDGDKVDPANITKPNDVSEMKPEAAFKIGSSQGFTQIANAKVEKPAALPAGSYCLHLTVRGTKSWDRQSIPLQVK